jgi:hypothetical protein
MVPAHFLGIGYNPLIVTEAGLSFTPPMFQFGAHFPIMRATRIRAFAPRNFDYLARPVLPYDPVRETGILHPPLPHFLGIFERE